MTELSIDKLQVDHYFSEPVFLDSGYVLFAPEMPITQTFLDTLKTWHISSVHSNGVMQDTYAGAKNNSKKDALSSLNDTKMLHDAEDFYAEFLKFTDNIFSHAAVKQRINYEALAEKMKVVCDEVKQNRRYLLQVQKNIANNDESFLAAHAVKSTIIAIIIGTYLKLPAHRLIELGIACLVHEIGMVRLPSNVFLSKGDLSAKQKEMIFMHPNLGFDILKASNFPMAVCAAAYEHHERENGNGYPRHLAGQRISLYGKIIAVACSYEAITAKRPHREAQEAFVGIADLLRNNGKQYDDSVVRALVFSLSVYPIGQFVVLTNGHKAQVVDVNPDDPRYPIVQVLDEQTPDGKNKIIETSPIGIHVQAPIETEERS
ncbi:MAG: HD-GYP domain-containing protein [Termitinemataceae bacterium]|nr:MAG: HD-GYP domain-containing protein [Termitinemataceae bacterium]